MTTQALEDVIHVRPFRPFRLVLDDGEEITVRKPKAHVSGNQVALVGSCRSPGGAPIVKFRLILADRIVSAEHTGD
jgi:hypothetical protein